MDIQNRITEVRKVRGSFAQRAKLAKKRKQFKKRALSVQVIEADGLRFFARTDSTDEKVIPEVIDGSCYFRAGFLELEKGDAWADLGANIGIFSILVASVGCNVFAFEPEPSNVNMIQKNAELNNCEDLITVVSKAITLNGGSHPFYIGPDENHYRHTLIPIRGRRAIEVESVSFQSVIDLGVNAIKMDIEGAEFDILDSAIDWSNVNKFAFEYHFRWDKLMDNFYRRMDNLSNHFTSIHYSKMPAGKTFDYFPAGRNVLCIK